MGRGRKPILSVADRPEIEAMLLAGETYVDIAEKIGCSPTTLHNAALKWGLHVPNPASRFRRTLSRTYGVDALDWMIEQRSKGVKMRRIGYRFGITRQRVSQILAKARELGI